jgi:pilus assembly protein CpaF
MAAIQKSLDALLEFEPNNPKFEHDLETVTRNHLLGFGPLQPLLDNPDIEEIWINGPNEVFIAEAGISKKLNLTISDTQIKVVVEKMLRETGRRLDRTSPFVDASLADGSRLHVVIPDITKTSWSINIRKFPKKIIGLEDLVTSKTLTIEQSRVLIQAIRDEKNILVSGATQSGKTTLLCALLNEISPNQRIVSVEETFELKILKPDWVALQTRQANLEGIGEVTLRRLIKEALRMRPNRLIVGEVREAESLDLLIALNSGLPGACTIHANSAREAILKLCTLPLLAGQNISSDFVVPTVGNSINVVVHCKLNENGSRVISEILEVSWSAQSRQIEFSDLVTR